MNLNLNFNLLSDDISALKIFDPRARIFCAFLLAVCISLLNLKFNAQLFFIALIPVILLISAPVPRVMLHVNAAGFLMLLFMAISFNDYRHGLYEGLIMLLKLNFICVIFLRLIAAMGIKKINAALYYMGFNEKLRLLLILTVRGIFILTERYICAVRAVNLRVQNIKKLKLKLKLKIFACLIGSALIQSMKRSDKISVAIKCRGGFAGFNQAESLKLRLRDCVLCLCCVFYAIMIFVI